MEQRSNRWLHCIRIQCDERHPQWWWFGFWCVLLIVCECVCVSASSSSSFVLIINDVCNCVSSCEWLGKCERRYKAPSTCFTWAVRFIASLGLFSFYRSTLSEPNSVNWTVAFCARDDRIWHFYEFCAVHYDLYTFLLKDSSLKLDSLRQVWWTGHTCMRLLDIPWKNAIWSNSLRVEDAKVLTEKKGDRETQNLLSPPF